VKWIQLSPGHYKLVEDDDERPAVKLKNKRGAPTVAFTPSWKKYEQNYWTPDSRDDKDLADKFIAERDYAMKTDSKAKKWEEGRKQEWARNKPEWIKRNQHTWAE